MSENKNCRILLVDDDLSSRMLFRVQLNVFGYEIIEAADGVEAVERFQAEQPDLVLMDINMPRKNGYQAAREIKELCGDNYVPILFITAADEESAISKSTDAGGDDFLVKPLTPIVLEARIRAALRRRSLYQQLNDQRWALEQRRIHDEREQELAKDIFSRIAHLGCLDEAGIEYVASSLMVFNGDMLLAERTPYGALRVMLGDFTGHGLPAAVGSLPSAETFYGMTSKGFHIAEVAGEINAKLHRILPRGIFCAAALIELNSETQQLSIWNGGLPHLLLHSAAEKKIVRQFDSVHLALGILPPGDFDATIETHTISEHDRLIAYTDGIVETENTRGELYGDHRLMDCMQNSNMIDNHFGVILDDLEKFREHAPQRDDYTLIEIPCGLANDAGSAAESQQAPLKESTEWSHQLDLRGRALAEVDPVPLILQSLGHLQGLDRFREDLFTILTELYVNALDHGVLKMDSAMKCDAKGFADYFSLREQRLRDVDGGFIKISLGNQPEGGGGRLTIRIEDSGDGFDEVTAPDKPTGNCLPSGRGIALVRALCHSLDYSDGGRCAEARYDW